MPASPTSRKLMFRMMEQEGNEPMTALEIATKLGWTKPTTWTVIRRCRPSKKRPDQPKLMYIAGWHRYIGGKRGGRWAAKFAMGDLPDKRAPAVDAVAESKQRYRDKHAVKIAVHDKIRKGRTVEPIAAVSSWLKLLDTPTKCA